MKDKNKTIKTIALVLIAIIFLSMFYNTFFKAKKNSGKAALKKQPTKVVGTIQPQRTAPTQAETVTIPVSGSDPAGNTAFSVQPFKSIIPNIFEPPDSVKFVPKKEKEEPKPIADAVKSLVKKIVEPSPLSDQEKESISQDFQFTGSILSSKGAVAIINDEFIHVGDIVNGYKVASISEQQVFIDTGRGTIILEIMTYE
ncbi:MAG: hypothetical protein H8D87_22490 [Deltaproteobacteria bacterium]|uniref:hypothetical protein n=1 Tax=Desulfobacula sp. TaxID=2593537 RepID=UPI0019ACF013|nr:hypothetical protein [Candidatus Desulfobacula maris]MBL6993210.1 hypothetical protein [Desulfobacula sp.]